MGQYSFSDTNTAPAGNSVGVPFEEYIQFGEFDSRNFKWRIIQITKDTPSEKEMTESVSFMQGIYDFSMLDGERYFNNREIRYQIELFNTGYADRKDEEQRIKRLLMPKGQDLLFDSHDQQFYWLGKCKSVSVTDNYVKRNLIATIIFDCYPFAIGKNYEGNDVWDDVYFPDWVFQEINFEVNGERVVTLLNVSDHCVNLSVEVDGNVTMVINNQSATYSDGTFETLFSLVGGNNEIKLSGTGTIKLLFYREVMI